jgi:hypothetical protein
MHEQRRKLIQVKFKLNLMPEINLLFLFHIPLETASHHSGSLIK